MDEKKKVYILISIFILISIVLLVQHIKGKPKANMDDQYSFDENSKINNVMSSINKEEHELYDDLVELTKDMTYKKDPFHRQVVKIKVATKEKYVLQGIFWEEGKIPSALINDQNVNIGAKIQTATVLDIQKDRVILKDSQPEDPTKDGIMELIFQLY